MMYVAFLRGINVGGKAMVSMAELKTRFEALGHARVKTYINSGNVLFSSDENDTASLAAQLEQALSQHFRLDLKVLVKSLLELTRLTQEIPAAWTNDQLMRCDVLLLWPDVDSPDILQQLPIQPALEDVRYLPGAVVWRVDRANATKSRLTRIVGTPLYKQLTIRNVNTVRKVLKLLTTAAETAV